MAERTKSLAVAAISGREKIWHSGYANIFSNPEFADLSICESLFSFLEEVGKINQLFFGYEYSSPINVFFGEELGWPNFSPVGVVATHFNIQGKEGGLGVVGPVRISYSRVIPIVKYFRNLIEEVANV